MKGLVFSGKKLATLTAGVAAAAVLIACGIHTRPFIDAQGQVIPVSIATMETLPIGGIDQHVWFRGVDARNPVLILLHGGPGASEAALFRHYNAALEQKYLVVYWEQRGAGRSYHSGIPPASMNAAQFVSDLGELVRVVQSRFGKRKVVLLAHSWGTVIGIRYAFEHPENVAAYVAVAQIADAVKGAQLSYRYALGEAERQGNQRAIDDIRTIGPAPQSAEKALSLAKWVERFSVDLYGTRSTLQLIWAALGTDEANLVDLVKFGQGNRFSLEQLYSETSKIDLMDRYQRFEVPVVFLLGRHDWNVPSVLSVEYFGRIQAPCKRLIWFERSGHNPPFDEPAHFDRVMNTDVLSLIHSGCDG